MLSTTDLILWLIALSLESEREGAGLAGGVEGAGRDAREDRGALELEPVMDSLVLDMTFRDLGFDLNQTKTEPNVLSRVCAMKGIEGYRYGQEHTRHTTLTIESQMKSEEEV